MAPDEGVSVSNPRDDGVSAQARSPVRISTYAGPREAIRALFELAEDSPEQLDSYLDLGQVLVAIDEREEVVGHLQLVRTDEPGVIELKNMAVTEARQGSGVGRALVEAAIDQVASEGSSTLEVATAAADIGNLRFYQRLGFRMKTVERDAFTSAQGYPEDVVIEGIPLRDRVWLDQSVSVSVSPLENETDRTPDADVLEAEALFFSSLLAGDAARLSEVLSHDFTIIDVASGRMGSRDDFVAALGTGQIRFTAIERDVSHVSIRYRSDTALVIGTTRMTMAVGAAQIVAHSRYTHVYQRATRGWLLFAAQGTPVTHPSV